MIFFVNFLLTIDILIANIIFLICIGWVQTVPGFFYIILNIIRGGDSNELYNH